MISKPLSSLALVCLALAAFGCTKKDELAAAAPEAPRAATAALDTEKPVVEFETTLGSFKIRLEPQKAPETVKNFLQYVDDRFYEGTIFHRVIPGFVVQGGGFTPELQEKATRAPVVNEAANGLRNVTGSVAMARTSEPNSATSQFYVNLKDNRPLDHRDPSRAGIGYAVFGQVIEGMDVVERIAQAPRGTQKGMGDVPNEPIVIKRVRRVP